MRLPSWLKRLQTRLYSETALTRARRRAPLCLEELEPRDVPATLTVTSLADTLTPGTLRYELSAAGTNDTINFAQTLAGGTISLGNLGELPISQNVTIANTDFPRITIDARQASRVFDVTAPKITFVVSGLNVTGGHTTGSGGGVDAEQGGDQVTIENSDISGNSASAGGGVYVEDGQLTIENSNISGNAGSGVESPDDFVNIANSNISGNSGGGVSSGAQTPFGGVVTIANSNISHNSGGGVSIGEGTVTDSHISGNTGIGVYASYGLNVTNSTIRGNGGSGAFAEGVTLTNSTVSGNGGGVGAVTSVTIANSTISKNSGYGVDVPNRATISNSTISGNTITGNGGGVSVLFAVISNSTISGNTATGNGGGVYAANTATISNSTISGNTAGDGGGGIQADVASITNSTIDSNSTIQGNGGGIAGSGIASVSNSTVSGNTARHGNGGGIAGAVSTVNSTISGNTAATGGGVFLSGTGTDTFLNDTVAGNTGGGISINGTPSVSLTNTIVANNLNANGTTADDILGPVLAVNSLIRSTTGATFTAGSTGNIVHQDPKLLPLGNYGGPTQTMALRYGSPAIDAGASTGAPATDQRDVSRPAGSVDIGAFQSQGFTLQIVHGRNRSGTVDQSLEKFLTVRVASNDPGVPVSDIPVTFTVQFVVGAGGTIVSSNPATTNRHGIASVILKPNDVAGIFTVTAEVAGVGSVTFSVTNGCRNTDSRKRAH